MPNRPTVSIYQNSDHVAGILQQIHQQPLVLSESREQGSDSNSSHHKEHTVGGEGSGGGGVPWVGNIGVGLTAGRSGATDEGSAAMNRRTLNFQYSQAYYLYEVRNRLREAGHINDVAGVDDARGLKVGDFVEFTATFGANEITALLDILSPDLVAAVTRYIAMSKDLSQYQALDEDEREGFAVTISSRVAEKENLARVAASAVRVDFRTEKTREFYGTIGDAESEVTAITICDNLHFVVEDEDRILDGEFTVLGKVTSRVRDDVPVLERNKMLDRIRPEAVDDIFDDIREAAAFPDASGPFESVQKAASDVVDIAFASRIEGPSFRVVPIAIFI